MDDIQGKKCLFQIKIGDDYTTALCWRSITASFDTETKEITTRGDGRFKDFDYKAISYKVNGEGVTRLPNDLNATIFDFAAWQKEFKEIEYRVLYQSAVGLKVLRGIAIIENCTINAQVGQVSDGSISLLGKAEYFLEDAIPDLFDLFISIGGNDAIQASMRFKLLNGEGDTIFDSAFLPESETNHLPNPTTVVAKVQKGNYAYWWQVITESNDNNIEISLPVPETANFDAGNNSAGTYPIVKDFTANRSVIVTLGTPAPDPTCVDVTIVGSPALPDGEVGEAYAYSFAITGTAPFVIANATKPAWMNITVDQVNKLVIFTGTPDVIGTAVEVSFDITNCATGTTPFNDSIDVVDNPEQVVMDWSHAVDTGGNLTIFKNGVLELSQNIDGAGSFYANPGDSMEVIVTGSPEQNCHLEVSNNVEGDIYNDSSVELITFSWTVLAGRTYNIISEVTNI